MILEFLPVLFLTSLIALLFVHECRSACRLLLVCLLFYDLCSWFEVLKPSLFLDAVSLCGLFFNTGQRPSCLAVVTMHQMSIFGWSQPCHVYPSCCSSNLRMTCVGNIRFSSIFSWWKLCLVEGHSSFFVWSALIWFNCTKWSKYCLWDKCMEKDTHNDGLCISLSLHALWGLPSVLCLCGLFSAGVRATPVCLLSVWPAFTVRLLLGCVLNRVLENCSNLAFIFWLSWVFLLRVKLSEMFEKIQIMH